MHFKKKSANVKINFLFPEPFSAEINSPVRVGGGACFKKDLNSSSLPGLKKKSKCAPLVQSNPVHLYLLENTTCLLLGAAVLQIIDDLILCF